MADILVAADDPSLASKLSETLALAGHRVRCVTHPSELVATGPVPPDLLILGPVNPVGLRRRVASIRRRQETARVPILALVGEESAPRAAEDPNIDDFAVLPVSDAELRARTESLIARQGPGRSVLCAQGLCVDRANRLVTVDGRSVVLTHKEFELLVLLMTHRGQTLSRRVLLREVWGSDPFPTRTVDVHVSRLRSKLGRGHGDMIRTVRQIGYLFELDRLPTQHAAGT